MDRTKLIKHLATEMPAIAQRIRDRQNSAAGAILSLAGASAPPMEVMAAEILDVIEAAVHPGQFVQ